MRSIRTKALPGRQRAGLVLILIGLTCFGAIIFSRLYFIKPPPVPKPSEPPESFFPVQISIPKVKISLPVSPAKVEGESWEISEKGASYLLGSGIPGQKGNVVIFGHNKNSLLGPARWLIPGDEIKLINQKNEEFVYRVTETKIVLPKQVDILAQGSEATLTIYTCSGFLDKQRFVLRAKLQDQ